MCDILLGLTVWVGIWDLVDYTILPAITNSSCAVAETQPGPSQLTKSFGCIATKISVIVLGTGGLWVTRSLYGSTDVAEAQFQPYP